MHNSIQCVLGVLYVRIILAAGIFPAAILPIVSASGTATAHPLG
jgi:hypothetical protein